MNYEELDACVRGLRNEMIDFTTELVGIASENPPGSKYVECVRAIEKRLRAVGLPCEVVKYRPRRGMRDDSGAGVVLSSVGTGKRTLYFSGHYDVVPVTTPGQCTPVLRGKMLFGRGSSDMKSGLAAMLYAAVALHHLRVPLDGRVGLVFVPDEETGGQRGSGTLIGGRVEAGSNFNVVPGRCVFTVDRRMNPEEDYDAERRALFAVFDEARRNGVKLAVEELQEGRPSGTSEATPLGRALSRHVRGVTGKAPKFEMCPGLLEIRFYAEQGVPAYAYGPGLLPISHGPKEFVDTDRIVDCAAIYARVAVEVLNQPALTPARELPPRVRC